MNQALATGQVARLRSAIDDAIEALDALGIELNNTEASSDVVRRFNAYHLADIEGTETGTGWLVSGALNDALKALRADVYVEAQGEPREPVAVPWTPRVTYIPEGLSLTPREIEIIDEHAGELDKDAGANEWSIADLLDMLERQWAEETDQADPLARELEQIGEKYAAAGYTSDHRPAVTFRPLD